MQSSRWKKLSNMVKWTPFIQTYRKRKYPWVQLAGHSGSFIRGSQVDHSFFRGLQVDHTFFRGSQVDHSFFRGLQVNHTLIRGSQVDHLFFRSSQVIDHSFFGLKGRLFILWGPPGRSFIL